MSGSMTRLERETVRDIELDIVAAGEALDPAMMVASVRSLLALDVFDDIRGIEELATRIGSSSKYAPKGLASIATDACLTNTERGFAALSAAIGHRRAGDVEASEEALRDLEELRVPWADIEALTLHLRSLNLLGADLAGLKAGINLSRRANRLLPGSPGFMHGLAHLLLEYGVWDDSPVSKRTDLWREALELTNGAIELRDWPKFHFTRGRILLRLGSSDDEIAEALRELRLASQLESKNAFDSNERRIQYALERSLAEIRIVVRGGETELARRLDETIAEMREQSTNMARELGEKILIESRAAQNQSITIIGFVTVALGMLPLATSMFGFVEKSGLPLVLAGIASFAVILWGAVGLATWSLNRGLDRSVNSVRRLSTATPEAARSR